MPLTELSVQSSHTVSNHHSEVCHLNNSLPQEAFSQWLLSLMWIKRFNFNRFIALRFMPYYRLIIQKRQIVTSLS